MTEKKRYSDEELEEFRAIINEKLRVARENFKSLMEQLRNTEGNGVEDTSPTYKALEEGSASHSKKEIHTRLGSRYCTNRKQNIWYRPRDR